MKGIILWELLTLEEPWLAEGIETVPELFQHVCAGIRPKIPKDCAQSLEELIEVCWAQDRHLRPNFEEIVLLLDDVLLEYAIDVRAGRLFWSEYFSCPELEESVSWKSLKVSFSDISKIDKDEFEKFYPLLVNEEPKVTIDSFNNFINWFGSDFILPQNRCHEAFKEIQTVISKNWFHGYIEQREANSRLALHPEDGTYLIRLSTTQKEHPFTISMNMAGKPVHIRIKKTEEEGVTHYGIIGHSGSFRCLVELVDSLIEPLRLVKPCPNTSSSVRY